MPVQMGLLPQFSNYRNCLAAITTITAITVIAVFAIPVFPVLGTSGEISPETASPQLGAIAVILASPQLPQLQFRDMFRILIAVAVAAISRPEFLGKFPQKFWENFWGKFPRKPELPVIARIAAL